MANSKDAVNNIYKERGEFIVIGLTGRTGSGCTTVANILKCEQVQQLDLQASKDCGFDNDEDRKYRVICTYANQNWTPFKVIEMTSIISSFVFQHTFDELKTFLNSLTEDGVEIHQKDQMIDELKSELSDEIDSLSTKIACCLTQSFSLSRETDNFKEIEANLLDEISLTSCCLKNILKKYRLTYTTKDSDEKTSKYEAEVYTFLFQQFGNNIRSNGDAFNHTDFSGTNMFDLARRANDFIKAIRYRQRQNGKPSLICIDAIRNPYEATYFKDRYSAFYLFSVNTEDEERRRRLSALSSDQINSLDSTEYPPNPKNEDQFKNQNIAACIELSDIHIYNPHSNTKEKYLLTEQIVKYVMLMMHPGLVTPSKIEYCMQIAYNAKLNSGCLSRQVGAVVTNDSYCVKSIGWNEAPEGQVPCNLRDVRSFCKNHDYSSHSKFELENTEFNTEMHNIDANINYNNLGGRLYPYCFKDIYNTIKAKGNQVHTRAVHAEENAFLEVAKHGGAGIEGGFLFTTASPCELCSKKAYQLGITKIYYIDPYPGISQSHILNFGENNPHNPQMELFHGAIGKAYTALYSQRLTVKDELKMLTCK